MTKPLVEPFNEWDKRIVIWIGDVRVFVDNDDVNHNDALRVVNAISDLVI